jgi:hypothetical protein
LNPNAPFNPNFYNFFDAIVMKGYCTTSTYCLGKLNRKRALPMEREKQLSEILSTFYDLSIEEQTLNFSDTCFSIGNLTKTIKGVLNGF